MEIVSVEVSDFVIVCDPVTNSVSGAWEINFPLAIIFSFDEELKNWQIIPLSFVISEHIKYVI